MALKLRQKIVNDFTMLVGSTEIVSGAVVKITSAALAVATASSAAILGVIPETGVANGYARVAGPGSIVFCNAHDDAISEGEWVVPAAAGRVDGIGTLTAATQYVVGIALQASSAQDQKVAVLLIPHIATKAAS